MTRELSTVTPAELRRERRRLLDEWDAVDSATKLLEIQERIADQIQGAEQSIKAMRGDLDALRSHIKQLRLYADGLAWRVLHPHVIRQLSKNAGDAPSLIEQHEAFNFVLRSARRHVEASGLPVLIADITNVIKIGDLIVVADPELPQIVECKTRLGHPRYWMQGRIGRQISRALGTLKYLSGKPVKVHGEDHVRVSVESQHEPERNWDAVGTCVAAALDHGYGSVLLSDHELVSAFQGSHLSEAFDQLAPSTRELPQPFFAGTSLEPFDRSDGLLPPPIVWPLAPAGRFAVAEGEVIVIHFVSARAFERGGHEWRIQVTGPDPCYVSVFLGEEEYRFSDRFIRDVLYAFETVDSCVTGLLTCARQVRDLLAAGDETLIEVAPASGKPDVVYLGSQGAVLRFAVGQSGDAITVSSEGLLESVQRSLAEANAKDSAGESG